ncbi:MAG: prepilin-type N-terminal cleavage/methylation domain-containing protein [Clostridiales bacterium]|nr:prepilin-type N-terminal cleavage/methylation domain-containing protein [Clostridiales bacterium]
MNRINQRTGAPRRAKHLRGFTVIELLVVMMVLSVLGGVLITLVHTGGSGYNHTLRNYEAENEARTALSYITVKVRQNDENINGADCSIKMEDGILKIMKYIEERDPGLDPWNNRFEVAFDLDGGKLTEQVYENDEHKGENLIAEGLRSLNFEFDEAAGVLAVDIGYNSDGRDLTLSGKVFLRSELN